MKTTLTSNQTDQIHQIIQGMGIGIITLGVFGIGYSLYPLISHELSYEILSFLREKKIIANTTEIAEPSVHFSDLIEQIPQMGVTPVNTTNSLVIEKLNINVPIAWDTSVVDPNQYNNALKTGVAHAAGTQKPNNRQGNTYLFAHSTLNPLEIEKYAASFTLLHRLKERDRISAFSDNKRYDYLVQTVEVVSGFNTDPFTRQPNYPMLTLQTCDPPGIPLNRLIVTARLISVYPL